MQRRPKHCSLCGGALAPRAVEGRERPACPECGFVHYANPASAVAGAVLDGDDRVLLIRRRIPPFQGHWALPAGYQEADEDPRETALREVLEETGIVAEVTALFDVVWVPDDPRKPANVIVYLCRPRSGELCAASDAVEAGWFPLDALPEPIGFHNAELILSRLPRRGGGRGYTAGPPRAPRRPHRMSSDVPLTYRDAGVDIDAQAEALADARDAIRASFTPGVVSDVGLFGGLFDLAKVGAEGEILVASADGVGTKLEVAKRAGVYDTVGRDLVHHCIGDILVQGARPLFFLDYVGTGRLEPAVVSALIRGCAEACAEHGLALLGGETAEMPGLYAPGDFDLVGFIVGSVRRDAVLDGGRVRPGQKLLGLTSSGLHTNGYSLARKVLFERLGLDVDDRPPELEGRTVGEALLAPHRCYLEPLWPLVSAGRIAAMAHVTGGGITDNLPRVLGRTDARVDRSSWTPPGLFRLIVEGAGIGPDEAYRALNMGVGMVLVVDPEQEDAVRAHLEGAGERVVALGDLVAGEGRVRWVE